jgi:hypothetical protein
VSRAIRVRRGLFLAGAGLVVSAATFVPGLASPLPWPIFLGGALYLMGGLTVATTQPGPERDMGLNWIRIIRIGIIIVVVTFLGLQMRG